MIHIESYWYIKNDEFLKEVVWAHKNMPRNELSEDWEEQWAVAQKVRERKGHLVSHKWLKTVLEGAKVPEQWGSWDGEDVGETVGRFFTPELRLKPWISLSKKLYKII